MAQFTPPTSDAARQAFLKKIAESSASGGGNRLTDRDGDYLLEVAMWELKQTFGGFMSITELFVLEAKPQAEAKRQPWPVGTKVGYVQNLASTKNLSAGGNVKKLMLALYDEQEADLSTQEVMQGLDSLTGKDQPAQGMLVRCSTYHQATRGEGKDITLVAWEPVKGQTPEQRIARVHARMVAAK